MVILLSACVFVLYTVNLGNLNRINTEHKVKYLLSYNTFTFQDTYINKVYCFKFQGMSPSFMVLFWFFLINSLHAGIFSRFFCCQLIFFKPIFFRKKFSYIIKVPNSLDPDQNRRCVGPDLVLNCSKKVIYVRQTMDLAGRELSILVMIYWEYLKVTLSGQFQSTTKIQRKDTIPNDTSQNARA